MAKSNVISFYYRYFSYILFYKYVEISKLFVDYIPNFEYNKIKKKIVNTISQKEKNMKVKRFIGGAYESNGYVLYHESKREITTNLSKEKNNSVGQLHAIIIDPGYSPKKFTSFLREKNLILDAVILTHHHYDHTGAIQGIMSEFEAEIMIHIDDADMYGKHIDRYLYDGDELVLNGEKIKIIHTPGHTKGGISILANDSKLMFTGDTIFLTELGRTDLTDGDEQTLMDTVNNIIENWDNSLNIYPGHGDGGVLGNIKKNNSEYNMLTRGRDRYVYFD